LFTHCQHRETAGSVIVGEWPGLDGLKEATDGTVRELGLAGPFPATQDNRQNMVEQPWAKANGVSPWLTAYTLLSAVMVRGTASRGQ
jgi:hypothetical protein